MSTRELITKVEGRGVDGDKATVLIYRLGEQISLVATVETNGDAEVILDAAAAASLGKALQNSPAQKP